MVPSGILRPSKNLTMNGSVRLATVGLPSAANALLTPRRMAWTSDAVYSRLPARSCAMLYWLLRASGDFFTPKRLASPELIFIQPPAGMTPAWGCMSLCASLTTHCNCSGVRELWRPVGAVLTACRQARQSCVVNTHRHAALAIQGRWVSALRPAVCDKACYPMTHMACQCHWRGAFDASEAK